MADVSTRLTLDDGVSGAAKSAASALDQAYQAMQKFAGAGKAADAGQSAFTKATDAMKGLGNAATAVAASTTTSLSKVVDAAAKAQKSLSDLSTGTDKAVSKAVKGVGGGVLGNALDKSMVSRAVIGVDGASLGNTMNKGAMNDVKAVNAMTRDIRAFRAQMQNATDLDTMTRLQTARNLVGRAIPTELQGPRKAPSMFSKAVGWVGEKFGPAASNAVLGVAGKAVKVDEALSSVGMSLGGVVAAGAAAAAAAVMAVVAAVGMLVFKLGELAVNGAIAFTKFTLSVASFRQDSITAFNAMLKNKAAAEDVYNKAVQIADATPFQTPQVINAIKGLMAGGFKTDELESMMNSLADLSTVKGVDKLDQLVGAMAKLKSEGKLTGETMERLKDAGLPMTEVAKQLGVSFDRLSGVSADKAIPAIKAAIQALYGGAAAETSKNLSGLFSTLSDKPFQLFDKAMGVGGGGLSKFVATVQKSMEELINALNPNSYGGVKIISVINAIGDALNTVAIMAKALGEGLLKGLSEGFSAAGGEDAANTWKKVDATSLAEGFKAIGSALGYASGALAAFILWAGKLQQYPEIMTALKVAALAVGVAILLISAGLITIVAGLAAAFMLPFIVLAELYTIIDMYIQSISKVVDSISSGGSSAVSGFVDGFTSAMDSVVDAAGSAGTKALAAFKASFGLGGFGGLDGALGMGGMGPMDGANVGIPGGFTLSAPLAPPSAAMAAGAPTSRSDSNTNNNVTITLSGVGLDIQGLAALIRSECTALFRELTGGAV